MRVTNAFREYAVDQLSALPGLRAQAMFGGIGLYVDDVFFGLIASDVLYLKVDDTNRADYEATGALPFKPYDDRDMTMPYYPVPAAVLEDATTLTIWARRSVAVAKASKTPTKERSAQR